MSDKPVRMERRIVRALLSHLSHTGWAPCSVDDGGDMQVPTPTAQSALEAIFALDTVFAATTLYLWVAKGGARHWILLVCGNDTDIISDYSYSDFAPDGFDIAMDAFDPETASIGPNVCPHCGGAL